MAPIFQIQNDAAFSLSLGFKLGEFLVCAIE